MYEKPRLDRFGTFRELTQLGSTRDSDFASVFGITSCNPNDKESKFGCGVGAGSPRT